MRAHEFDDVELDRQMSNFRRALDRLSHDPDEAARIDALSAYADARDRTRSAARTGKALRPRRQSRTGPTQYPPNSTAAETAGPPPVPDD